MKSHQYKIATYIVLALALCTSCSYREGKMEISAEQPDIFPEYYDLSIPSNIAPLNFMLNENGGKFRVEFSGKGKKSIILRQRSPEIRIPVKKWKALLDECRGDSLHVDISIRKKGKWISCHPIRHFVTPEDIDPFLAYRIVHATYLKWHRMGIYQRDLSSFRELPLIENSSTGHGCMNCHAFAGNDPTKMMLHFRILQGGTMIWNKGKLSKINTKIPETPSAGIYPSWHPEGTHIAFSVGKLNPHMTSRLDKPVDVADRESDIVIYDLARNSISAVPALSSAQRENMPLWSPDGRTLYYISAPEAIDGDLESLLHARYSLMRIPYSTEFNLWGEAEVILNADSLGASFSMPSISPDGKYIICSMSDYGYFTIFHKGSDLCLVDLETGEFSKPGINSSSAESFSSWSSNSRWIVFSSKRMDNVYSRPHLAYMDEKGKLHRPFVIPQKDPAFYKRHMANYNLPRLVTGEIEVGPVEIIEKFNEEAESVKFR